jgi:hypothetical protein
LARGVLWASAGAKASRIAAALLTSTSNAPKVQTIAAPEGRSKRKDRKSPTTPPLSDRSQPGQGCAVKGKGKTLACK